MVGAVENSIVDTEVDVAVTPQNTYISSLALRTDTATSFVHRLCVQVNVVAVPSQIVNTFFTGKLANADGVTALFESDFATASVEVANATIPFTLVVACPTFACTTKKSEDVLAAFTFA